MRKKTYSEAQIALAFRLPHTATIVEPHGSVKSPGNPMPNPKTCTLKSEILVCHFLRRRTMPVRWLPNEKDFAPTHKPRLNIIEPGLP